MLKEDTLLPCVELESEKPAEAAVVWLHGLGADGHDFEPVAKLLQAKLDTPTRFVLPHAPQMSVTINNGMSMPAWYDMLDLEHPRNVDWKTVSESETAILALLQRELNRGIAPDRLFLAGFSQGGAMALRLSLNGKIQLKGVIALSTYLLQDEGESFSLKHELPIFMGHGTADPIIPMSIGEASRNTLKSIGADVVWESYPMPHSVSNDEIADILSWLQTQLGDK